MRLSSRITAVRRIRRYLVLPLLAVAAVSRAGAAELPSAAARPGAAGKLVQVAPGVWRLRLGTPEAFVPTRYRTAPPRTDALAGLAPAAGPPFSAADVRFRVTAQGCVVELPLRREEQVFGFGLNLTGLDARGFRKTMLFSEQEDQNGSSHAPVPLYISNQGYAVLVDTARYATFYCGNLSPKSPTPGQGSAVTVSVPAARGVDLYLFAGPSMGQAVQRYNLFSGGGCLPPLWGLGVQYRGYGRLNEKDVLDLARYFRDNHIPCDVFGLEPGWQSHAYSCSFVWNQGNFPDPAGLIEQMHGMGYRINLWEHAFVHPSSPLYAPLTPLSGDYLVWGGLVPDFSLPETQRIFGDYHRRNFADKGISAFKLDECDDLPPSATPWSFPSLSAFPSGMDGEQMHSLFGVLYQQTHLAIYTRKDLRTYGLVRSSQALAAPLPYVLYSDTYDHRNYVRGVASSGLGGVLWAPEVRGAGSLEDLYRRMETAVFSAQTLLNTWEARHPFWLQPDTERNNRDELLPNGKEAEAICRRLLELRMRLIPYLYSSFAEYHYRGIPPFRAVVTDYPDDKNTWNLDDEYLAGPSLLVAPLFDKETKRSVYLPAGDWYDFWTGQRITGGRSVDVEKGLDQIPVFVKGGTLLPLANPVERIDNTTTFDLTVRAYGKQPAPFVLYEDDGVSLDFEKGAQNRVTLNWTPEGGGKITRAGAYKGSRRYTVSKWEVGG